MKPEVILERLLPGRVLEGAPYPDNAAHLADALARLDLLLAAVALEWAGRGRIGRKPQELVARLTGTAASATAEDCRRQVAILTETMAWRQTHTTADLRLPRLSQALALTPWETEIVLLALAPALDPRYARMLATLQGEAAATVPTLDLALALAGPEPAAQWWELARLSPLRPLWGSGFLSLQPDPRQPHNLRRQRLVPAARLLTFLLGGDQLAQELLHPPGLGRWLSASLSLEDLILPPSVCRQLQRWASSGPGGQPERLILHGASGSGRKTLAAALAAAWQRPVLGLDLGLAAGAGKPLAAILAIAGREALLYGAALYLDKWDQVPEIDHGSDCRREIAAWCRYFPGPLFLAAHASLPPGLLGANQQSLTLPLPGTAERRELWGRYLPRTWRAAVDLDYIAATYNFTGGQIRQICDQIAWENPTGPEPARLQAVVVQACRRFSWQELQGLGRLRQPQRQWEDLVLPPVVLAHLQEFWAQGRYRGQVLEEWGFREHQGRGLGQTALFSGPPGTGKTLAAEVLAGAWGRELLLIDLAGILSKYIGETEQNLRRVFAVAQAANAVLFFDEADGLFGKRTEIRDAHDRYANLEINYLLKLLEDYEGIVILATNLSQNLDPALTRRLQAIVAFPFPDESLRLRIWERIFPRGVPLAPDLDLPWLAASFAVSGGSIKNVALAAAYQAAAGGGPVTMRHLVWAMKREYQKLGKLCDRSDFGPYYDLVAS